MNDNCCYECKDRHIGCHSTCKKYKTWKAEFAKQKLLRRSGERSYYDYFYHNGKKRQM